MKNFSQENSYYLKSSAEIHFVIFLFMQSLLFWAIYHKDCSVLTLVNLISVYSWAVLPLRVILPEKNSMQMNFKPSFQSYIISGCIFQSANGCFTTCLLVKICFLIHFFLFSLVLKDFTFFLFSFFFFWHKQVKRYT